VSFEEAALNFKTFGDDVRNSIGHDCSFVGSDDFSASPG
jgi:hypothetical protein